MDTIFALSSAPGRAGVALVRISGPAAFAAVSALTGKSAPAARRAVLRRLRDPQSGVELDQAIVVAFPAPHSFTGEDVVELHLHGGRAVLRAVVGALAAQSGLRPAEAGEFTRRAFENGRLDLTAAEGLADLVGADTEAQRIQALRQLGGELGTLYDGWRASLLRSLAHIEAHIDFPEEELPAGLVAQTQVELVRLQRELAAHLNDQRRGERLRDGVSVAILGAPNVGKSSLINKLAGREAAIVSAHAGTTRDVIEVHLDLAGYPVVVADTAGLRSASDEVESEGVRRALDRAERADIRILMFDATALPAVDAATVALANDAAMVVINKVDLVAPGRGVTVGGKTAFAVSARSGDGIEELVSALTAGVVEMVGIRAEPVLTRARHRHALEECRQALERAAAAEAVELLAEDLRLAVRAIGRITGRVDVEDLLDIVFREFCIGK